MALSSFRDRLESLIEILAKPFLLSGLKPNHITLLGLLVGLFAGFLFYRGMLFWAGVSILLCGYFDLVDGAVAKTKGKTTEMGGVLDSFSDRLVDGALYVGIIGGGMGSFLGVPFWVLPSFALVGSYLVSYVRARAEAAGSFSLDVGVAERAERLIILAVGAFLGFVPEALVLIVVLTVLTILQRLKRANELL